MLNKYYDSLNNRLIFQGNKGDSANFWDTHWICDNLLSSIKNSRDDFIINNTNKYLNKGNKILEGGCGRGNKVYILQQDGFNVWGVDFAIKTVEQINNVLPELQVSCGDVRSLSFADNFFDGYWSLGVIEHFYEGIEPIVKEMSRVVRKKGYVFITFPTMSPLRRLKAFFNIYANWKENNADINNFYQFALSIDNVNAIFESYGFELVSHNYCSWFKGLKDEVSILRPILQWLYDGESIFHKAMDKLFIKPMDKIFAPLCGHMSFIVFRKL